MIRKRIRKTENEVEEDRIPEVPSEGRNETHREAEERIIDKYKERITGPISGIRAHCIECFGAQVREVANCPSIGCALWPFRMGVNTLHKRSIEAKDKRNKAIKEAASGY